jgi:hypothetical protein
VTGRGPNQTPTTGRFLGLDDPEPPPGLWRRWVPMALALVAVIGIGVVRLATHPPVTVHRRLAAPVTPFKEPRLPSGTTALPGVSDDRVNTLGLIGQLSRADDDISRRRALETYDLIPGAPSRAHRKVFTTLARVAFVDHGQVSRGNFWIVSVWFHPPNVGSAPQRQWCVVHGFVRAESGTPSGHVDACLTRGVGPTPVFRGRLRRRPDSRCRGLRGFCVGLVAVCA